MKFSNRQWIAGFGLRETGLAVAAALALGACGGSATAIHNGRVYVAAGNGGLAVLK